MRDDYTRITAFTHNQSTYDQTFGYDNLDRLSGWSGFNSTQGFGYDLTGNRTSLSIGGSSYPYTVQSSSNRVTQTAGPGGSKSFGFDAAGNTTSAGSLGYAYDARGRMISATTALGPVTYQLNALGQRVAKTVSGTITRYHYDANGNLIGETTGTTHRDYAWLGSLPVAILEGTSQYYIHADHIDTPRVVTNASNTIVWRWDSDPFGFFPAAEDPDGNSQLFTLNLRFPGQYFDKETVLHYNYFRDYDPQTGRYVESDPIGLEGGVNTYAYANQNPTSYIDPDGKQAVPMPSPMPPPSMPFPWKPKPRHPDPFDLTPSNPGWGWPTLPDWLTRPFASESSEAARERCEAACDKDYDFDQKQCEVWWKTTGRIADAYRACMDRARANYIKCYQDCASDCK